MILKDRFCGLSKASDFQRFLKEIAPDLYQDLLNHLQLGEGCQSNKKEMIRIYDEIKSRGSELKLLSFIKEHHPHMVLNSSKVVEEVEEEKPVQMTVKKMGATTLEDLYAQMNHHKVFRMYKPRMLFIPHQKIFVGPTKRHVSNQISKFELSKVHCDHIILQGPELWHGYVEYFEQRYSEQAKAIDPEKRPIAMYRKRNGIKRI